MVLFPNAKINLGLNVISKRKDGFHNLETIFYPVVELADVLEIVESTGFSFEVTGIEVDSPTEDNLCVKAYKLLQKEYQLPPVAIHLHKIVPTGAGLGGGSSDAAFTLMILNGLFDLGLSTKTLKFFAARLGSDCAFFIDNVPSKASGRGEILSPVEINLKGRYLTVIKPDIHVGTKEAYREIVPRLPEFNLLKTVNLPVEEWKNRLVNDFEPGIFRKFPQIAEIKERMYSAGAVYASMSGSGASVFGLFDKKPENGVFSSEMLCFEKTYLL